MTINGKSVVIGVLIGLVLGLFIPINLLDLLSQSPGSSYTSVTVVEGHAATVKFGEYEYYFAFTPLLNAFTMSTEVLAVKSFEATEGAVYQAYGIEIVVSKVHSDRIVLLVKPVYQE